MEFSHAITSAIERVEETGDGESLRFEPNLNGHAYVETAVEGALTMTASFGGEQDGSLTREFERLEPAERVVLNVVAQFPSGCTLEPVEAICEQYVTQPIDVVDTLAQLVDKSLLVVEERDDFVRYYLRDAVRQRARGWLPSEGRDGETSREA
jgi:hypothetical protein